ncbi:MULTISPECIES: hypothetical protein [Reichenbachiella]|uniref:Uncharacterized protein n=1 Tax=Reichenbachiella agariperforans TaxID=156994 RepID=A0A1M6NJY9_REIAG|nr:MULTISPECIES: hypothetical protein [Reichenbachiella]MBU2915901.1 hypothetical protein [Reichenbachiella agariperforans]SHJ95872.1 hypothetical protein SAMN04488028_102281 [Reichenbachiella agariperforans]
MKKKTTLIIGTLVAILLVALLLQRCKSSDTEKYIYLGETFSISDGETLTIRDTDVPIYFESVLENSLCPEDVVCIRWGSFTMRGYLNHKPFELSVGDSDKPDVAKIDSYQIKLTQILYPVKHNDPINDQHPTHIEMIIDRP